MNENNANGTAHLAYHARTFSDQYNNAPPYSPPSTSHTSDSSTTPTISHSNNQDFNGDQEQGIQFRNGYHHNEYEGEEYDDYEGQKEWITVVPGQFLMNLQQTTQMSMEHHPW